MKLSIFATLSLSGAAAVGQSFSLPQGNCTVFKWDGKPAYLSRLPAKRVSAGAYCSAPSNQSCPITAHGDELVSFRYNVTKDLSNRSWNTPQGPTSFLRNIIYAAVNESLAGDPFNETVVGSIDTIRQLPSDEAAYIDFEPLTRCFVGTMQNCSGGPPDGLAIEACAPVYHTVQPGGMAILDGVYTLTNISRDNVSNFRDPYAGMVRSAGALSYTIGQYTMLLAFAGWVALFMS